MLLTVEEAKAKWCPLARAYQQTNLGPVSINRDAPNGMIPACIASACMAWRWSEGKKLREIDMVTSEVVDEPPRTGYCGAFIQPFYGE